MKKIIPFLLLAISLIGYSQTQLPNGLIVGSNGANIDTIKVSGGVLSIIEGSSSSGVIKANYGIVINGVQIDSIKLVAGDWVFYKGTSNAGKYGILRGFYVGDPTTVIDSVKVTGSDITDLYVGGVAYPLVNLVNAAPEVQNHYPSGVFETNDTVVNKYTYFDNESDPEGATTFQWLAGLTATKSVATNLVGETNDSLITISDTLAGWYVFCVTTPVAMTGSSPGEPDTTSGYYITEADYVLVVDDATPITYIDFENDLFNAKDKWAVYFEMANYQELVANYGHVGGVNKYQGWIGLSESGKLSFRDNAGTDYTISTIIKTAYKNSGWDTVMVWARGDSVHFDVNDEEYSSVILDATTTLTFAYFIDSYTDGQRQADGKFNNLRTRDLSDATGNSDTLWCRDTLYTVMMTDPDHYFKFNEGRDSTVYDEMTSDTGRIWNFYEAYWEKKVNTIWNGSSGASDAMASTIRPNYQSLYDIDADSSYVVYPATSYRDPKIFGINHNDGEHEATTSYTIFDQTLEQEYQYPNIAFLPDNRIVSVYSNSYDHYINYSVMEQPGDMDGWVTDTLPTVETYMNSYPFVVSTDSGHIHVYVQEGTTGVGNRRFIYQYKSEFENGVSWWRDTCISRYNDPEDLDEVYLSKVIEEPRSSDRPQSFWFVWIAAGGPSHDTYHADIYVARFIPDSSKFFSPDDTDLGSEITLTEQNNNIGYIRAYQTTRPVTTKDVGYIHSLAVDTTGKVMIDYGDYYWNGASWESQTKTGIGSDMVASWWADSYWWAANNGNIYRSNDAGDSYEQLENNNLPGKGSDPISGAFPSANIAHTEAYFTMHEGSESGIGKVWYISANETQTSGATYLRTETPKTTTSTQINIYGYVTEKTYGSRARVRDATDNLTLSIQSGGGSIGGTNPQAASSGKCSWTFTSPGTAGVTVLKVNGSGIDPYWLHIYYE